VIDALGHVLDVRAAARRSTGANVRLTIDHTIQANAEAVLRQTVRQWHAKGAPPSSRSAHRRRPRDGDAPGFDANAFGSTPPAVTRNRASTDVYEPGSTFKLVTVAGVLSDRLVTPQTTFTLPYSIHVADRVIHDAESAAPRR
jgi:cell division protein FtsI (penicillin-binding protein 3)